MLMKLKRASKEVATEETVPSTSSGGAFISARLRNPAEELAAQSTGTGDMIGGVCAIVATVMLVVITALLYFNWDAIKSA
jgi:hypothetical protein